MDPTLKFLLEEMVSAWDSGDPENKLSTLFPLVKKRLEQPIAYPTPTSAGPTQAPHLPQNQPLRRHSHKVKRPVPFGQNPNFNAPSDALSDPGEVNQTGVELR